MRKITQPEIEKLYEFTRKHFVEYYDLQTELVDHLANGMEARWQENPHLSFEENLNLEFKKFGVFGFSDVVEKRQRAMEKKYYGLIWNEIKQAVKRPKAVFFLIFAILVSRFFLEINNGVYFLTGTALVLLIAAFIYRRKIFPKRKKGTDRVFLLEEIIRNAGGMSIFFIFPFNSLNLFTSSSGNIESDLAKWLYVLMMAVLFLICYICFWVLPKKKDEILEKAYPQWKMME